MKKIVCVLTALALLCGLALAEGNAIKPMTPDIDLAAPADGIYVAMFRPADLADDVIFTDGWDIESAPVTVAGAEAVAEAIHGTELDAFICCNTTVRVEGGRIAEIVRVYMP